MVNLSSDLIVWYKQNMRELPWRKIKTPYNIWVSEIILQQTRVNQGLTYYLNFIDTFPTVAHLANASEDDVLKCWQGLGYYSRARNMHAAAKHIHGQLNGKFPDTYSELLKLKGIGSYTAAAISSICFNEHQTVVDGNVFRVLSRLFGIYTPINTTKGKKEFEKLAHSLNDGSDSSTFNQALMEFGAIQCVPKNPDCSECIFMQQCYAQNNNEIVNLPQKEKKPKVKNRYLHYIYITDSQNQTIIQRRNGKDIWNGLYQFPLVEFDTTPHQKDLINLKDKLPYIHGSITIQNQQNVIHKLSHQTLHIYITHIKTDFIDSEKENKYLKIPIVQLEKIAFPKPLSNYISSSINQ